jgi:hypothetical protein
MERGLATPVPIQEPRFQADFATGRTGPSPIYLAVSRFGLLLLIRWAVILKARVWHRSAIFSSASVTE